MKILAISAKVRGEGGSGMRIMWEGASRASVQLCAGSNQEAGGVCQESYSLRNPLVTSGCHCRTRSVLYRRAGGKGGEEVSW